MARSLKKGPYIDTNLLRKIELLNRETLCLTLSERSRKALRPRDRSHTKSEEMKDGSGSLLFRGSYAKRFFLLLIEFFRATIFCSFIS